MKAAYLSDEEIISLAADAATARTKARHKHENGNVIPLQGDGDAA
jgi:hypothetical protein